MCTRGTPCMRASNICTRKTPCMRVSNVCIRGILCMRVRNVCIRGTLCMRVRNVCIRGTLCMRVRNVCIRETLCIRVRNVCIRGTLCMRVRNVCIRGTLCMRVRNVCIRGTPCMRVSNVCTRVSNMCTMTVRFPVSYTTTNPCSCLNTFSPLQSGNKAHMMLENDKNIITLMPTSVLDAPVTINLVSKKGLTDCNLRLLYHSFSSLCYDRSKASSKASSPYCSIHSFLLQMTVSSPFLKVIQ